MGKYIIYDVNISNKYGINDVAKLHEKLIVKDIVCL